jgi:hypothetical protein
MRNSVHFFKCKFHKSYVLFKKFSKDGFCSRPHNSINGNQKPCSVVVQTERVLFMIIYSKTGCLNLSFCRGHPYCNHVIITTVETTSCDIQQFPITNHGKSCEPRYYLQHHPLKYPISFNFFHGI